MTLTSAGARRRGDDSALPLATGTAPYAPAVVCTIPPYTNGSLNAIHPSVHDFGQPWNGYRWWMANTPYPTEPDENPCIYASNDQITWETPAGLTNPIDPWPGQATNNSQWYNSDTELFVDDAGRLVCLYREYLTNAEIKCRVSADGVTWSEEHHLISEGLAVSPSVVRWGPGDFRLWFIGGSGAGRYRATDALGPWQYVGVSATGMNAHHGDVMRYSGNVALMVGSDAGTGGVWCGHSLDGGVTWSATATPAIDAGVVSAYRPTIAPSRKAGWIDVWIGGWLPDGSPSGTGTRTAYTRVPLSAFGL